MDTAGQRGPGDSGVAPARPARPGKAPYARSPHRNNSPKEIHKTETGGAVSTSRNLSASTFDWTGRDVVAGVFPTADAADGAVNDLRKAGFKDSEIGMAVQQARASDKQAEGWLSRIKEKFQHDEQHEVTAGDVSGPLEDIGIPADVAQRFENAVENGSVVVLVRCGRSRSADAIRILRQDGADLSGGTVAQRAPTSAATAPKQGRIQLLGEILRVQKQRAARGEVRVHKEVVTQTQSVDVPVSHEEVVIERRPASGGPQPGARIEQGQDIRIPVTAEQVRVEKQPVVTGEVAVKKQEVQDTKRVSDQMRHEELRVEREGNVNVRDEKKEGEKAA